ncbi:MAG TPA: electron transfer flavoprotein subunit alpha/FixB family protein, partial [Dehalococcoidia bacterium]
SPTWVGEVYEERPLRLGEVLTGDDPSALAHELVERLLVRGAFARRSGEERPRARQRPPERGQAVLVWVESQEGRPRPSAFELLGAAGEIADAIDGHTVAITGSSGDGHIERQLAAHGADRVLAVDEIGPYRMEPAAAVLSQVIRSESVFAVLLPASADGRDLAPRVAARLGLGLTGDCIGLRVDEQERLVMLKPAFGGNIIAPVYSTTSPAMATVRPGLLAAPEPLPHPALHVTAMPRADGHASELRLLESRPDPYANVSELTEATIVVGVGRGVGGPEHLPAIRALAAELHAEIGATRVVTDLGWLPRQRQVGLTGRAIAPALYLAVGVSGSFNHMVGVLKAGTIVAINRSPRAPITKTADYTIVGDWAEVVPALTTAFAQARGAGRLPL